MDRELLAAQSGGKLLPELCSLLENHSNEGTPPDFDASFWKRGRENVFLQMEQSCTGSKFFKDYCPRTSHVMFSGSNFSPEKSLQKILSRKICRFFVSKISPATGVTPVAGPTFETKIESFFLESFFRERNSCPSPDFF